MMRISIPVGIILAAFVTASAGPAAAATFGRSAAPGRQADIAGGPFDPGTSAAGRFLAARHAEAVGNLVAAADLTAGIIDEIPAGGERQRRAHLVMVGAGRLDAAAELAGELAKTRPADPLAVYTLAVRELRAGAFDSASKLLDLAPASGMNAVIASMLKAWALAGQGRTAEAVASLEALAGTDGFEAIAGFHQALIADLGGDAAGAEAAFRRTLDASGERPSIQLVDAFARFLVRNAQAEEAAGLVAEFTAGNPRSLLAEPVRAAVSGDAVPARAVTDARQGAAAVFRNIANLLDREQLRAESLLFVRMALHLVPGDAGTQFSLAQLLENRDRGDLAVAVYRQIDASSPYSWYARLGLADALHAQGDSDAAIRLLRMMSGERPERSDAPHALADLLRIDRRFDEAVKAYDRAIDRLVGEPDWRLLYTRGIALERAMLWDRAEKDFLRALELEPDQPLVLNYLGYSWVEQGVRLERAKTMIEIAVAKRPRDGFITDSLGWVLYRMGDFDGAVVHLERAVSLEPGDPVINDHLGDAYWLVGRRQEARFQWQRSLSLDPEADLEADIRLKLAGKKFPDPMPPGKKRGI